MPDADLTLQQAADVLGVHYMTAYRYVRLGVLPATKSGGTWRVQRDDLEQFRAGTSTAPVRAGRPAPWAERLEARLLAGDGPGAWGVVEAALSAGTELDELYLDVLSPALVSIGIKWETGEIDVALEHRATGIAMRLIGRLGPRFLRRGRSRGTVVVGAPEGERHALPSAMLADLLRAAGWDVSDLGADTPASSFAHAVTSSDDIVAVGVSVIDRANLASVAAACVAARAAAPHVLVVVGGRALEEERAAGGVVEAAEFEADRVVASAREMIALLDELGELDQPDRLGRPAEG